MKFIHKTLALLGLALALAGTASAQTTDIFISGATTYRAPVHQAICDLYGANAFSFAYTTTSSSGGGSTSNAANPYKANAAVYSGTIAGVTGTVVFHTFFTGSAAGVFDLAKRNTFTGWMAAAAISDTHGVGTAVGTDSAPTAGGKDFTGVNLTTITTPAVVLTAATAPDATLSDAFDSSIAPALGTADTGGTTGVNALGTINNQIPNIVDGGTAPNAGGAGTIGLIAFEWVMGRTTGTQITATNLNWQTAFQLIGGGLVRASFLTGATADNHNYVCLVGRNEDSGTRICSFAEAQQGFGNPAFQYQLTFSANQSSDSNGLPTGGAGSAVTGFGFWPANSPLNTEPSISWANAGHSGYIAGGDVKSVLQANNPVVHTGLTFTGANTGLTDASVGNIWFVGYLGIADAGVGGNAVTLSYNGVPYSVAAVSDGSYTLWGYEHLYYLSGIVPGALSGNVKTVADKLADKIYLTDADVSNANTGTIHGISSAAGILLQGGNGNPAITVTRSVEGGPVSSTF